jgi:hypothetical protein
MFSTNCSTASFRRPEKHSTGRQQTGWTHRDCDLFHPYVDIDGDFPLLGFRTHWPRRLVYEGCCERTTSHVRLLGRRRLPSESTFERRRLILLSEWLERADVSLAVSGPTSNSLQEPGLVVSYGLASLRNVDEGYESYDPRRRRYTRQALMRTLCQLPVRI